MSRRDVIDLGRRRDAAMRAELAEALWERRVFATRILVFLEGLGPDVPTVAHIGRILLRVAARGCHTVKDVRDLQHLIGNGRPQRRPAADVKQLTLELDAPRLPEGEREDSR